MKRLALCIAIALVTLAASVAVPVPWSAYERRAKGTLNRANTANGFSSPAPDANLQTETETEKEEGPTSEPQRSKYLRAIEIISRDEGYPLTDKRFEDLGTDEIEVGLDLGDSVENQLIVLRPHPGKPRVFKIERQYETVLTLWGEGPDAKYLGQKYFISEWREINRVKKNTFLIPKLSKPDQRKHPRVALKEVSDAVFRSDGKEYAEYARGCRTLTNKPCDLLVSGISFRIKVKEGRRWKVINQINFIMPISG